MKDGTTAGLSITDLNIMKFAFGGLIYLTSFRKKSNYDPRKENEAESSTVTPEIELRAGDHPKNYFILRNSQPRKDLR